MKAKIVREVALLCLPVLIIGGVLLRDKLIPSSLEERVQVAREGELVLLFQRVFFIAPADDAASRGNVRPVIHFGYNSPLFPNGKVVSTKVINPALVDERGKTWPATLVSRCGVDPCGTLFYTPGDSERQEFKCEQTYLGARLLDFRMPSVPASAGELYYRAEVRAGDMKPVQINVLARPAWMTRPAQGLKVVSVKYLTGAHGARVEAVLKQTTPVDLRLANNWQSGITYFDSYPMGGGIAKRYKGQATLFTHWNERIVEASQRSRPKLVDFKPVAEQPDRVGNNIVVTYSLLQLPTKALKPVFEADVMIEDDGYLRISCPLPQTR